jgi:hypothetical protein
VFQDVAREHFVEMRIGKGPGVLVEVGEGVAAVIDLVEVHPARTDVEAAPS